MREYRPSRTVTKHDDRCTACGNTISKGTCIARLFNYRAHGRTVCEDSIIERYNEMMDRQRKARMKA